MFAIERKFDALATFLAKAVSIRGTFVSTAIQAGLDGPKELRVARGRTTTMLLRRDTRPTQRKIQAGKALKTSTHGDRLTKILLTKGRLLHRSPLFPCQKVLLQVCLLRPVHQVSSVPRLAADHHIRRYPMVDNSSFQTSLAPPKERLRTSSIPSSRYV